MAVGPIVERIGVKFLRQLRSPLIKLMIATLQSAPAINSYFYCHAYPQRITHRRGALVRSEYLGTVLNEPS